MPRCPSCGHFYVSPRVLIGDAMIIAACPNRGNHAGDGGAAAAGAAAGAAAAVAAPAPPPPAPPAAALAAPPAPPPPAAPTDAASYHRFVDAAGGRVRLYFRDYYAQAHPNRTLCVPLSATFLRRGGDGLLMELAVHGFRRVSATRMELDDLERRVTSLVAERARVEDALTNFERDYFKVNHGPTHHAVKARERRELEARKAQIQSEISLLLGKAVTVGLGGAALALAELPTLHIGAGFLQHCDAAGSWMLSLFATNGSVHAIAVTVDGNGRATLFDPDWAIVEFRNIADLANFIITLLNTMPGYPGGKVQFAKVA